MSDNFLIQDHVQHVYRQAHYGRRSALRQVARKLKKLRMYFFLMVFCATVGAMATFLTTAPPRAPQPQALDEQLEKVRNMSPEQKSSLLKQVGSDNATRLMEQYKNQIGKSGLP